MYLSSGCMPHLLPPRAYYCPDYYEREKQYLREQAWHVVGSTQELARPGDFLTLELLEVPIQVRNFEGRLHALSNVCAHRHCLISDCPGGNSPTMKCQYHGWEYGSSGKTRRIPKPDNFVPFPDSKPSLPSYRVEAVGGLVWVSLSQSGPSLPDYLGPIYERCLQSFGAGWELSAKWNLNYPANWKVPVENSLEAYHVPSVHPRTFKQDPGDSNSVHVLEERYTSFTTRLPFAHTLPDRLMQRAESWMKAQRGEPASGEYSQHHLFPNLLVSFTDTSSFCQCVVPTGPQTSLAVIRMFGPSGEHLPVRRKMLTKAWNQLKALVTRQIVHEDMALFASVQKGLRASPHAGMLGRCEERIHAFQTFWDEAMS